MTELKFRKHDYQFDNNILRTVLFSNPRPLMGGMTWLGEGGRDTVQCRNMSMLGFGGDFRGIFLGMGWNFPSIRSIINKSLTASLNVDMLFVLIAGRMGFQKSF